MIKRLNDYNETIITERRALVKVLVEELEGPAWLKAGPSQPESVSRY